MPDTDAAPALPDDIASLKAMVLAQTAELAEIRALRQAQEAELAAARAGLIEQRFEIEALKSRLARLQRMTFGRSSEKLRDQVEQLELVRFIDIVSPDRASCGFDGQRFALPTTPQPQQPHQ